MKEGGASKEMHNRLIMDIINVRRWVKKFQERKTATADMPRIGRLLAYVTDKNQQCTNALTGGERHISVQNVVDALNLSFRSTQRIISGLGYNKNYVKLIPNKLTVENWRRHMRYVKSFWMHLKMRTRISSKTGSLSTRR